MKAYPSAMSLRRKARRFTQHPVRTQAAVLRRLLRVAAGTEWGRRYEFADLAQEPDVITAYQQAVPLHTYSDVAEDVHRTRLGEPDILWPGRTRHFAVSSGTASAGTILPLSREMVRRNILFSFGVAQQYLHTTRNYRILLGSQISMPGRIEEDLEYPGTFVGETSGFLLDSIPPQFRFVYRNISHNLASLPHWNDKLSAIVDRALDQDIRLIATVPSWAVSLFRMAIERYNRQHGTTVETVGEIWPNLQLFISGGVALSSYRALLEQQIGLPEMHYLETYGASEGFFSYQVELDDPNMLLDLDNGLFFEFLRFDAMDERPVRRYSIAEVEAGVRYVPCVTSCSGLWAYPVGDVVRFTSIAPHKIQVAGRTSEMLDRYGEKVFGEDARLAITRVCQALGVSASDYHVTTRAPSRARMPKLHWLVEFEAPPVSMQEFAGALDAALCDLNRHYRIRREAEAFDAPQVTALSPGSFARWLQISRRRVGIQSKVRRLSEDTATADALTTLERERGTAAAE